MLFRLIPEGDIDLADGVVVVLGGPQFVRQKIATRLKFFLGEWFLDLREGIPYYRDSLVKNPDLEIVRTLYRAVILSVQEVKRIDRLDLKYDSGKRTLGVEFDISLIDGGVLQVRQPDPAFIIALARAA